MADDEYERELYYVSTRVTIDMTGMSIEFPDEGRSATSLNYRQERQTITMSIPFL